MKTVACNGPISSVKGHYMGLNLGVFWQTRAHKGTDFWMVESDGFTGVFQVSERKRIGARFDPDRMMGVCG